MSVFLARMYLRKTCGGQGEKIQKRSDSVGGYITQVPSRLIHYKQLYLTIGHQNLAGAALSSVVSNRCSQAPACCAARTRIKFRGKIGTGTVSASLPDLLV